MIVGFDYEDVGIFQDTFDFLQEAGIPFTTAGVLFAIEHTPLYARLEREGRLRPVDLGTVQVHGNADLNFVPKGMSAEELRRGYRWMVRALYRYDTYGERLERALERFSDPPPAARGMARQLGRRDVAMIGRIFRYFLLTRDGARRRFFLGTLRRILGHRPSMQKIFVAISYLTVHKHFHEFVQRTHGNTESVGRRSPFAAAGSSDPAARSVPEREVWPVEAEPVEV
jgi:hypothetical protein